MPTYRFVNKDSKEIEEYSFSYTKLEEFKKENPHLEMYFSIDNFPVFSDGSRMSTPRTGQPDARFEREIIGRMKKKVAGNTLEKTHKTKMPREW
jgi:hypothetical protein